MAGKAQIKMFETIAVIIVFFFILMFGLVFYNSSQTNEIRKMLEEDKELRSIEIMKIATYLPELQCSMDNVLTTNCLDSTKLENFAALSNDNLLYYTNLFSFGRIYVQEIYPLEWTKTIYVNQKTSARTNVTNFIPILIFDPLSKRYAAGTLVVEVLQ